MALRLTHLYQSLELEKSQSSPPKLPKEWAGIPRGESKALAQLSSAQAPPAQPDVAIEASTAFGKLTISNATFSYMGNALNNLITNGACHVDAMKEKMGLRTLNAMQAEQLAKSGILDGEQWHVRPSQELQPYHENRLAVSGSLTFRVPGIAAYPLLCSSSAVRSLAALLAIGALLGPVEHTVDSIVDGALDATVGDPLGLGREYHANRLRRVLLDIHSAHRASKANRIFETFVLECLLQVPRHVRQFCAATIDKVKAIGIDDSQLRSIAEWAFSPMPRTLVLSNQVELLATAVVSTFLSHCRIAVVNCSDGTCQTFNDERTGSHGFAVYHSGTGQKAIQILHKRNWLQPYLPPESTRIPSANNKMRLCCSVQASLNVCKNFLQSVGIGEQDTSLLMEAIKKDAVTLFARDVTIFAEEQTGYSYTSLHNTCYYYEYGAPREGFDWSSWLGMNVTNLHEMVANRPTSSIQIGALWYHGYAAKFLNSRESIRDKHRDEMQSLRTRNIHSEDSSVSRAIGEVAGLIYAFALSCVHVYNKLDFDIPGNLGDGLNQTYSSMTSGPKDQRRLARSVCLGILSQLWLDVPATYIKEWPQTALGISNSQGSVLSAIVADTGTLEQSTTKFIVSTDIPDLMQAEQPVVACAATPASKVQHQGHEARIPSSSCKPYDDCLDVYCLTITGGKPLQLSSALIHNNVLPVPVVGYIACGVRWFEYVDLDDAFAVMAESFSDQPVCAGPAPACEQAIVPVPIKAQWLKAETMLERDSRGNGFTCAQPAAGIKRLVVPAHGSGLKQSFLCGVFRGTSKKLRYAHRACLEHAVGDVVVV